MLVGFQFPDNAFPGDTHAGHVVGAALHLIFHLGEGVLGKKMGVSISTISISSAETEKGSALNISTTARNNASIFFVRNMSSPFSSMGERVNGHDGASSSGEEERFGRRCQREVILQQFLQLVFLLGMLPILLLHDQFIGAEDLATEDIPGFFGDGKEHRVRQFRAVFDVAALRVLDEQPVFRRSGSRNAMVMLAVASSFVLGLLKVYTRTVKGGTQEAGS